MLYERAMAQILFVDCTSSLCLFYGRNVFSLEWEGDPLHTLFGCKALEAGDLFELSSCQWGKEWKTNFLEKCTQLQQSKSTKYLIIPQSSGLLSPLCRCLCGHMVARLDPAILAKFSQSRIWCIITHHALFTAKASVHSSVKMKIYGSKLSQDQNKGLQSS